MICVCISRPTRSSRYSWHRPRRYASGIRNKLKNSIHYVLKPPHPHYLLANQQELSIEFDELFCRQPTVWRISDIYISGSWPSRCYKTHANVGCNDILASPSDRESLDQAVFRCRILLATTMLHAIFLPMLQFCLLIASTNGAAIHKVVGCVTIQALLKFCYPHLSRCTKAQLFRCDICRASSLSVRRLFPLCSGRSGAWASNWIKIAQDVNQRME